MFYKYTNVISEMLCQINTNQNNLKEEAFRNLFKGAIIRIKVL